VNLKLGENWRIGIPGAACLSDYQLSVPSPDIAGIWIRPASASVPPAGEVWGGMRAGFGLGVFGKAAATKSKNIG